MQTKEIKVKGRNLALFLMERGCALLRTEHKHKGKKGPLVYYFEDNAAMQNALCEWEAAKTRGYFYTSAA